MAKPAKPQMRRPLGVMGGWAAATAEVPAIARCLAPNQPFLRSTGESTAASSSVRFLLVEVESESPGKVARICCSLRDWTSSFADSIASRLFCSCRAGESAAKVSLAGVSTMTLVVSVLSPAHGVRWLHAGSQKTNR